MKRKTIGIEAQRIFREKKHGMDIVVLELIRNLMELDKFNNYYIFVQPDSDPVIESRDNFTVIELVGRNYAHWEQVVLPRAVKELNISILHCTSNTAPLSIPSKVTLILTLHDIIFMESFSLFDKGATLYQKLGNLYRRWVVPYNLRRAKKVITVSDYEWDRIVDKTRCRSDQVITIYNGVGTHFKPIVDFEEQQKIVAKYRLPEKFLFFLGNSAPKKNTRGVLLAYAKYVEQTASPLPLFITDFDKKNLSKALDILELESISEYVKPIGYVYNYDLPAIYSLCELFLYPSLRESFGIPLVEAMACGAVVLTSNVSSLPEISNGVAIEINPTDISAISEGIESALNMTHQEREEYSKRAIERAGWFSWQNMAETVLSLYQTID